ncbi:MAG: hypothetical protein HQL61_07690 [Magnetococcales bacterium]|nr:hypothetical protein [Nitrospirota bacterium]
MIENVDTTVEATEDIQEDEIENALLILANLQSYAEDFLAKIESLEKCLTKCPISYPDIEYELQSVASVSFDQAINEMEEIMKPVLLRSKAIQDKGERDKEMLKSWNDGNRLKIEEVT